MVVYNNTLRGIYIRVGPGGILDIKEWDMGG